MTQGFENALVLGFANDLAAAAGPRVPLWTDMDADGSDIEPTPGGVVGIYLDAWPEDKPSVTLTDYPVADDPSLSESTIGVQVTVWHHDRNALRDIVADIFDLMHGRWAGTMGNVRIVTVTRRSGANLGQDNTGRIGRSENYYIQAYRPSANRQ